MARRRRTAAVKKSGGTTIVTVPAAAPARRRRSGGMTRRRRSSPRRRRSSGGIGGSGASSRFIAHGVGGFAVGFIEKSFPQLPSLPLIGRKGAIALGAYLFRGRHPILTDIGLAAAAISGYELGKSGAITGDIMGEGVAGAM